MNSCITKALNVNTWDTVLKIDSFVLPSQLTNFLTLFSNQYFDIQNFKINVDRTNKAPLPPSMNTLIKQIKQ